MKDLVKSFGRITTQQIIKKPVRARKMLAAAFRGFGIASKYGGKKDLKARNYMMWACNEATAKPLLRTKNTAIVSIFTPCEVLHAMGIMPVFPEGLGCYMAASNCEKIFLEDAEKHGVPETLCSYHKMLIGQAETGLLPKPDFILNTTMACDANQVSFRRLAEYFDVPHFVLDIPTGCSRNNIEYMKIQLKDMVSFIENNSGKKLNPVRLKEVMERASNSIENYRHALAIKAKRHESLKMTSHMVDVFALHVLLGTKEVEKYTKDLCRDLMNLSGAYEGKRLLWVHTLPYTQKSLCNIFNYSDKIEIVTCDMVLDNLIKLNPDKPYDSMARQLLMNSFNGSSKRRIERVLQYARQMNIDGIIYFCHWGCKQTLGASSLAKKIFEEEGFPTLVIDGDGCDSRNVQEGQMVTRTEAFLEQLEGTL